MNEQSQPSAVLPLPLNSPVAVGGGRACACAGRERAQGQLAIAEVRRVDQLPDVRGNGQGHVRRHRHDADHGAGHDRVRLPRQGRK